MRAIVLEEYGEAEVLRIKEIPDLTPDSGEVRVAVHAAGVNRADVYQRKGKYPPPGPKPVHEIPGLEFAGTVEALGGDVRTWNVGDRVFGLLPGGGYAEQVVTHERMLMPIPEALGFPEAAAVPEVYFTAWDALEDKAGLHTGETILIHAGGSGVGVAATQLAKWMGARRIYTTTRNAAKAQKATAYGAHRVIVAEDESFEHVVLQETEGRGADVILDSIGGAYLGRNLNAAALGGRIVQIAAQAGSKPEIPLAILMTKRLRLVGTTLRSRPLEEKIALTQRFKERLLPLFESKAIQPVLDRVFPFEEAPEAHRYMESNAHFGKIVLQVREYQFASDAG